MKAEYFSHIGLVRKDNEDGAYCDEKRGLFAVADGMGGCAHGEVASAIALDVLADCMSAEKAELSPKQDLQKAFGKANRVIWQKSRERDELAGMGTTLTAALVEGEKLWVANVGDSRAYLLRDGVLRRLTRDHSLVNELLARGVITRQEAENHPDRNVLTRALGVEAEEEAEISCYELQAGDLYLLSTDGLHGAVPDAKIRDLLAEGGSLKEQLQRLLMAALEAGGRDNITALIFLPDDVESGVMA